MIFQKRNLCFLVFVIMGVFVPSLFSYEVYVIRGTQIECLCGEAGWQGISYIQAQVMKNIAFAIELQWPEAVGEGYRYREYQKSVWVGGLDGDVHDGGGNGYNRAGILLRVETVSDDSTRGFHYKETVEEYYDSVPCVHNAG